MDEIVPEPLGGAHADPVSAFPLIKDAVLKIYSKWVTQPASCWLLATGCLLAWHACARTDGP